MTIGIVEKLCLCLFTCHLLLLQASDGAIEDRLKKDFFAIYTHTAFEAREIVKGQVKPEHVTYYLYTKNQPNNYTQIDPDDPVELVNGTNSKIVFIIHGWTGNRETDWYEDLKNAFLSRQEGFDVVQVDWREPADQLYTISSYNTKEIGNLIGTFIVNLHRNYSIPLDNFLLVGHSLGGQVSGFAGKKVIELTQTKLPRIVALDPAGPLFRTRPEEERLNKNDAEVVAVLHTDGGTFGFRSSCGTIDFYPNGGNLQPGCTRIDLLDIRSVADPIVCDHQRSCKLYVEAVLNPDVFVATKCDSWAKFELFQCDDNEEVTLGNLNSTAQGDFYFQTSKDSPYSKRKRTLKGLAKIPSNAAKGLVKLLQH